MHDISSKEDVLLEGRDELPNARQQAKRGIEASSHHTWRVDPGRACEFRLACAIGMNLYSECFNIISTIGSSSEI